MTVRTQLGYWIGAFILLCVTLYAFSNVLLPFVAGFVLAYFLDPLADWLEEKRLSRLFATIISLIVAILIVLVLVILLVPLFYDQVIRLMTQVPIYVERLQAFINSQMDGPLGEYINKSGGEASTLTSLAKNAFSYSGGVISRVLAGSLALINIVSLLLVTPIVAFYLLLDWDRMVAQIDDWLPREHAPAIRQIAHDIDDVLAGFLRGQMSVCAVLAVFYAISLTFAGLDYAIIVGLIAGGMSFIPFVGALIGLVLSIGLAIGQFWPDFYQIGLVALIFFVGQALEGNFLSPKMVGDHVKLHPVWIMFALLAFGSAFGFVGMLVAVPVAAVFGVLTRFGLSAYLRSSLYDGGQIIDGPPSGAEKKVPSSNGSKDLTDENP